MNWKKFLKILVAVLIQVLELLEGQATERFATPAEEKLRTKRIAANIQKLHDMLVEESDVLLR